MRAPAVGCCNGGVPEAEIHQRPPTFFLGELRPELRPAVHRAVDVLRADRSIVWPFTWVVARSFSLLRSRGLHFETTSAAEVRMLRDADDRAQGGIIVLNTDALHPSATAIAQRPAPVAACFPRTYAGSGSPDEYIERVVLHEGAHVRRNFDGRSNHEGGQIDPAFLERVRDAARGLQEGSPFPGGVLEVGISEACTSPEEALVELESIADAEELARREGRSSPYGAGPLLALGKELAAQRMVGSTGVERNLQALRWRATAMRKGELDAAVQLHAVIGRPSHDLSRRDLRRIAAIGTDGAAVFLERWITDQLHADRPGGSLDAAWREWTGTVLPLRIDAAALAAEIGRSRALPMATALDAIVQRSGGSGDGGAAAMRDALATQARGGRDLAQLAEVAISFNVIGHPSLPPLEVTSIDPSASVRPPWERPTIAASSPATSVQRARPPAARRRAQADGASSIPQRAEQDPPTAGPRVPEASGKSPAARLRRRGPGRPGATSGGMQR